MPLHVPPAPTPALRSVLAAVGSPTAGSEIHPPSLRSAEPLTVEHPLPVHVVDGDARRHDSPRTRLTGWRFLVRGGDRPLAAAEAKLTADGWVFSHFREGPYVGSTEQALRQAESLPSAYQPRLLSVPELYMLTLWLHCEVTADPADGTPTPADLLVPLAPAPPGITSHRPRRMADLLPLMALRFSSAPLLGSPA